MSNMYFDVATFIGACDQETNETNRNLYQRLIVEEFWEFMDAYKAGDKVEELDACMDMIWVILGYCRMRGFDVNGAWNEVSRSNLDKINPQIASRMVVPFTRWEWLDKPRQQLMQEALRSLKSEDLSPDVFEMVDKSIVN